MGHTGTLDPFATGLLVMLVGRATRLARFVEPQPKTYLATARLGWRTDTDDYTGSVVEQRPVDGLTREAVLEALARFEGPQRQRPPAYSAKHVGGERSHRLARRGAAVEPAEVTTGGLLRAAAAQLADPAAAAPLVPLYLRRPDATPPAAIKAVSQA